MENFIDAKSKIKIILFSKNIFSHNSKIIYEKVK